MINSRLQIGSVHVVIIVILVAAVLGALGYALWNSYFASQNSQPVAQVVEPEHENVDDAQESDAIDTTIYEVDLTLESESDLTKLPSYAPDSFREYLRTLLKDNKPVKSNIDGCTVIAAYQITKISQVNIQGGVVPKDIDSGDTCAGGAPAVWVLTPSGSWDEEGLNGPPCVSKNGGLIYSEFAPVCYSDADREGINNPNGSIESIKTE